jgi:GNAT superfamily N-acetyltransferase
VTGNVRPAGHRDVEQLRLLWRALAAHHAAADPEYPLVPGSEARWVKHARGLIDDPDARLWVYDEAGRGLGFCTAEIRRAGDGPGCAAIEDLFVREESRRSGAGRALVAATFAWLRERGIVRVEVRVASANVEGQAFWRALGFGDFVDVLQRRL